MISFSWTAERAPYWTAIAEGFFEEEGLEVEIVEGTGSATVTSLLTANPNRTNVFAVNDLTSMILAVDKGAPLKAVYTEYQENPSGIAYLKESGIAEFGDLSGKKIAFSPGGAEGIILPAALDLVGVPAGTYEQVSVDGPAKVQALEAGRVDAIAVFVINQPLQIAADGFNVGSWTYADFGVPLVGNGVVVTQATIENTPDVIRAFLRAVDKGQKFVRENPEVAIDHVIAANPNNQYDRDIALNSLRAALPLTESEATDEFGIGYSDPKLWEDMLTFMFEHPEFGLSQSRSVDAYTTNEFLPES